MKDEPVVALQGPRTVGKSTLLNEVAKYHEARVLDLDKLAVRNAVSADPQTFAAGHALVCIDEFQKAPSILDAIKAELNRRLEPGRFVITGSTRFDALPMAAQALTGRIHIMDVLPFSQGELNGHDEKFLDIAFSYPASLVAPQKSSLTRAAYIKKCCMGGMPLAVVRNAVASRRWFDDYVRVTLERDVRDLVEVRQGALLFTLLRRIASQTAQVINVSKAGSQVGLKATTAEQYVKLLEYLFLIRRVDAWGRTLRARAVSKPKIYVLDSGVAARLMGLTPERLASTVDPAALTELGHLFETFVVGEILKQVSWTDDIASVGHWRTYDGHEVDLVVERFDGSIIAFEVKCSARVTGHDTSGLRILRAALGDRFIAGFVLNTGDLSYRFSDRIWVVPTDRLWNTNT
ncbi:MAG: ATP-binding protein [Acidimicrobiia bacterium]|nr:ATP-binding protein [Acidimicrobiia bacterium]